MTSTNSEERFEGLQWVGKNWEGQQLEMFWKTKTFFGRKLIFTVPFKLNSSLFFLIRFMISSSHQGWLMMFQDLGFCQFQVKGNYLFFFSAILLPLTVSLPFLFTACHWSHSFILVWCKLLSGVDTVRGLAQWTSVCIESTQPLLLKWSLPPCQTRLSTPIWNRA